jgi:hypothetical protein
MPYVSSGYGYSTPSALGSREEPLQDGSDDRRPGSPSVRRSRLEGSSSWHDTKHSPRGQQLGAIPRSKDFEFSYGRIQTPVGKSVRGVHGFRLHFRQRTLEKTSEFHMKGKIREVGRRKRPTRNGERCSCSRLEQGCCMHASTSGRCSGRQAGVGAKPLSRAPLSGSSLGLKSELVGKSCTVIYAMSDPVI